MSTSCCMCGKKFMDNTAPTDTRWVCNDCCRASVNSNGELDEATMLGKLCADVALMKLRIEKLEQREAKEPGEITEFMQFVRKVFFEGKANCLKQINNLPIYYDLAEKLGEFVKEGRGLAVTTALKVKFDDPWKAQGDIVKALEGM